MKSSEKTIKPLTDDMLDAIEKASDAASLWATIDGDNSDVENEGQRHLREALDRTRRLVAEVRRLRADRIDFMKQFTKTANEAILKENERCAQVAEKEKNVSRSAGDRIAAAIRARGGLIEIV